MYPDEIQEIAKKHFSNAKEKACSISLKFKNGSKFDDLIAGWVLFWNGVMKPRTARSGTPFPQCI